MSVFALLAACTPDPEPADPKDETGTPPIAEDPCEPFGRVVPWDATGPTGIQRHDRVADAQIAQHDGTTWGLAERWTGCDNLVFVPGSIPLGEGDDAPVWSQDLDLLIDASPRNTHYFFVSTAEGRDAGHELDALALQRDRVLRQLGEQRGAYWAERIHVVGEPVQRLDGWVGEVLASPVGAGGFAVDRTQRIRGLGSFADVDRYSPGASWPYDNNLAYAAKEAERFNVEAAVQADLESEVDPILVPVFTGEVIAGFAEFDAELPTAAELAGIDTFELEIEMRCPDPALGEAGNCGAWDYLAHLSVQDDGGEWIELSRFITTYHREARWVVDATRMLPLLDGGGSRHFKWEWAPYWNTQPTSTFLTLRFADRGRGERPVSATPLAQGGAFGSAYNDGREPMGVPIPGGTARTELVVVVTGHGGGTNNCAEFCDSEHEFTVGDGTHEVSFPEAGTNRTCADVGVAQQMTPNQWGTWWYGRGGWCPGQPVVPHVFDVTADAPAGGTATVSYEGHFAGGTPPDGSGDILLSAWLVTWE